MSGWYCEPCDADHASRELYEAHKKLREDVELDLFGEPVDPAVGITRDGLGSGRSDGRKRTDRQAVLVALGQHPLMSGPIHPQADRSAHKSDGKSLPFRCGSCLHRITVGAGSKSYPKCDLTTMSHSEASDVRAWWPACPSYTPTPPKD